MQTSPSRRPISSPTPLRPLPGATRLGAAHAPTPLRPKPFYTQRSMTVCIAGACQHHGEPRIVLCCDSRLDFGEVGSTNNACKVRILGCGWVGLIAGDWTRTQYFSGIV